MKWISTLWTDFYHLFYVLLNSTDEQTNLNDKVFPASGNSKLLKENWNNIQHNVIYITGSVDEVKLQDIKSLLRTAVNFEAKNKYGNTALHWACSEGNRKYWNLENKTNEQTNENEIELESRTLRTRKISS